VATADRGERFLDARVIPSDFDWQSWDEDAEQVKVRPASDFMEEVIDEFYLPEDEKGIPYPWEKAQKVGMRFRGGEVTIYGGHSGSYKSIIQSQIALHLMAAGEKCMIASFEMRPKKTLARAVRQAAATDEPAIQYMREFKDWTTGKLWLYDHYGNVDSRKLLAVCRYSVKELGCSHLFIDSLMKVLNKTDDYNEQKEFVGKLCSIAQSTGCHIHLVAHSRKKQDDKERIGKFDVAGASEMEKQADNVLMIQRNRKKQDAANCAPVERNGELALVPEQPDVWLTVDKQRNGEFEGPFAFGFDAKSLSVVNATGDRKRGMVLRDRDQ
jgi:twinkle protein